MATLSDILTQGTMAPAGSADASDQVGQPPMAYLDYVEACQLAGKSPSDILTYPKWVEAGRPKGP